MITGAFSYYLRNSPKSFFIFMSTIGLFFGFWGGWQLYVRISNQSAYIPAQDAVVIVGESRRGIMENVYVSFVAASSQQVVGVSPLLLGQSFTAGDKVDVLYNPANSADIQLKDWRIWFDPVLSVLLGATFLYLAYQHGLRKWNQKYKPFSSLE
jgi:hypothetical protein